MQASYRCYQHQILNKRSVRRGKHVEILLGVVVTVDISPQPLGRVHQAMAKVVPRVDNAEHQKLRVSSARERRAYRIKTTFKYAASSIRYVLVLQRFL